MKHPTIDMTPSKARKPKNEFSVKLNISTKAVKKRVYPDIEVNDKVNLARKKELQRNNRHHTG